MRYLGLAAAGACHATARDAALSWRAVEHPTLQDFAESVFKLSRLARLQDDDTGWRAFLYPARRARNIATTVPLPFSNPDLGIAPLIDQLDSSLAALRVYGGSEAGELGESAVSAGHALASCDDAPLLDAIPAIVDSRGVSGLLLPIAEYVPAVREFLRSTDLYGVDVLSRHDIAALEPMNRLVVVGPLYWYRDHEYVLTSPRARQIIVLKWAWFRERPPEATVLEGSKGAAGIRVRPIPEVRSTFRVSDDDERSTIDWASLSREISYAGEADPSEPVRARATVLAGRHAVLLPEDGDRRVWLLDPHGLPEHRVTRAEVGDLELGHVIMLRTSGGGDLIVPIADELLGNKAPELRELQHRWKAALRAWVRQFGTIRRAATELLQLGCARANPQNLQNWLSERTLRTEDQSDWRVLMDAAGLGGDATAIWNAMGKLHSAHSKAGRTIGTRLRAMANTEPLDDLLQHGRQGFTLAQGGSVTAFRIEGFAPSTTECSPSRLLVPTVVRDEWLT